MSFREPCVITIYNQCEYILSEIENSNFINLEEIRRSRINSNLLKNSKTIEEATNEISSIFSDLYDINLHIFQSSKSLIVIDVRYFLKSKLDKQYQKQVIDFEPTLHIKISMPQFQQEQKKRFDINWELKQSITENEIKN